MKRKEGKYNEKEEKKQTINEKKRHEIKKKNSSGPCQGAMATPYIQ